MVYYIHHLENIEKCKTDLKQAVLNRIGVTGLPLVTAIEALIIAHVEAMKSEITDSIARSNNSTDDEGH